MVVMENNMYELLITQYNLEIFSALLYEQLAIEAYRIGLNGLANYFEESANEEREHSYDFRDFLLALDETPFIIIEESGPLLDTMNIGNTMTDLLVVALRHEQSITASIEDLVAMAKAQQNYQVETIALDYIKEQIEEEDELRQFITRLQNGVTDLIIDQELMSITE